MQNTTLISLAALIATLATLPASAQTVELVSAGATGEAANYSTYQFDFAANGRFVAFASGGSNLVPGDTNGVTDVFVKDLVTGELERVTGMSGQPNGFSRDPSISPDGRFVAFTSSASNLVPSDTNGVSDVFVKDRLLGTIRIVSRGIFGAEANGPSYEPDIDDSGRFVAFASNATNLAPTGNPGRRQIFMKDLALGPVVIVSEDFAGNAGLGDSRTPKFSGDASTIVFESYSALVPSDVNGLKDIYAWDRGTQQLTLVSETTSGIQADRHCRFPAVSRDGRWVGFDTESDLLGPADSNGTVDVYVRDMTTGFLYQVSTPDAGGQANDWSAAPVLSPDGSTVTFVSAASNLVEGDTNGEMECFRRAVLGGPLERLSLNADGSELADGSDNGMANAAGDVFVFVSRSSELPGSNGDYLIYVRRTCAASWRHYGSGHAGTLGMPTIELDANPVLGSEPNLLVGNSRGSATVGMLAGGTLQISQPFYGGTLLVSGHFRREVIQLNAGVNVISVAIPDESELCGTAWYWQVFQRDPGASAAVSMTRGLQMTLGR